MPEIQKNQYLEDNISQEMCGSPLLAAERQGGGGMVSGKHINSVKH